MADGEEEQEEDQEGGGKKKKRYFTLYRILGLLFWAGVMGGFIYSIFFGGNYLGANGFFLMIMFSVTIFMVLIDRQSFQVGTILVIMLAYFSFNQPTALRELIDGLNNRMQDAFFVTRGPKKPSGDVVIVDIDQYSLETVGQWPWPRSESARVVRNLQEDGARVICFDIVYAEPGRYSMKDWVGRLDATGIDMLFPGATLEESKASIKDEEWNFTVAGDKIRKASLKFWQNRFEEADEDFWTDEEDEDYEEVVVERFLENDEAQWYADQKKFQEEEGSNGREYPIKDYVPPLVPILKMARESGNLFFLGTTWEDPDVLVNGAPLIRDNDEDLGAAMGEAPVVAGGLFILGGRSGGGVLGDELKPTTGMVQASPIWNAENVFDSMRQANYQVLNVPALQAGTNFQGMFNIVPDKSGAARFYTMFLKAPVVEEIFAPKDGLVLTGAAAMDPNNYELKLLENFNVYPSIALEMLRVANGYNNAQAVYRGGQRGVLLKRDESVTFGYNAVMEDLGIEPREFPRIQAQEKFIPLDFKGDIRVNYLGYGGKWAPDAKFPSDYHMKYISISDVLYKRFEPGTFTNKYIILGSTDPTLSDLVGSPFRPAFPGLEVHATMLDNMITEDFLVDLGDLGTLYTFFGILAGGLILSALIAFTGPWLAAVFMAGMLSFLPGFAYYSMVELGVIFEFVYPWLSTLAIGITVILVNFFVEGREKRFMTDAFKSYMSPELIEQMVDSGVSPKLGGEENVLTAYFTDIQSFSSFSEMLGSPTKLVELLNEYLEAMTTILLNNGGTLDKYEGDAIIAFIGAPLPSPNHAYAGCVIGLKMQDQLDELRAKWTSEGDKWPQIVKDMRMRIGVNSGPIVTGNMGCAVRMNYTMMGDAVNLAARLEEGAKQYGVFTMCSQDTLDLAAPSGNLLYRPIDKVKVMGKSIPVVTYELLWIDKDDAPEDRLKLAQLFTEGKDLYEQQKWDEAIAKFEECMPYEIHHPDRNGGCKTTPSHVFIKRSEGFKENPPVPLGEEWDGVYTATSK
ncbi:MAG: class 3 adenylate cyclase/CHASE2 domain-containing sensor protein [Chlamydiales bacterium]|jgi:class 3 adenylate cyclase/CHASE2 domain-containing sensor protein